MKLLRQPMSGKVFSYLETRALMPLRYGTTSGKFDLWSRREKRRNSSRERAFSSRLLCCLSQVRFPEKTENIFRKILTFKRITFEAFLGSVKD